MKLALISDVHSNLEALDAVLDDIDHNAPNATLICAGDIVGYGPDPEACIARLQARNAHSVIGNHDEMVIGTRDFSRCIYAGITAAMWTRKHLSQEDRQYLEALPGSREVTPEVAVCHGNLESADTYISDESQANTALEQLRGRYPEARTLICGHTHHAAIYTPSTGFRTASPSGEIHLDDGEPCIVNPGAVGQSRDTEALARYALLDTENKIVTFHKVSYDHAATIRKLRKARLVAQVVLNRPQGIWQRIEWYKTRWARYRAEMGNAS